MILIKFGEFSAIISLEFFFLLSLDSPSGTPITHM